MAGAFRSLHVLPGRGEAAVGRHRVVEQLLAEPPASAILDVMVIVIRFDASGGGTC